MKPWHRWIRGYSRRIGTRLFMAFGAVAGVTVLSAIVAWMAFERLSNDLSDLTENQLPATALAARIAELGGDIRAHIPNLLAAPSEQERLKTKTEITTQLGQLEDLLERQSTLIDSAVRRDVLAILPQIKTNLTKVDENVRLRFVLKARNAGLIERLRWAHADFLDEVDPIVADARFNMETALDRLTTTPGGKAPDEAIAAIRQTTETREAVMRVNAAGNLAVGLIMRGANQSSVAEIDATRHFLAEVGDHLEDAVAQIRHDPSSVTLRQSVEQILNFSRDEQDVLSLRKQELLFEEQGRKYVAENRRLFSQLEGMLSSQIAAVETRAQRATQLAEQRIIQERWVLVLAASISVSIFIFVGWRYVAKRIVWRLSDLGRSMAAIAAGDLEAEVNVSGADEISEMAEALLVFRNTAQEVEDSNAQSIIDNSMVGLVNTNARGYIEFVNPSAEKLFGVTADQVRGKGFVETFLMADDRVDPDTLFNGRETSFSEIPGRRADGRTFYLDLTLRPYKLRNKRRCLVTVEDATERREARNILEDRITERTRELHEANQQLTSEIKEKVAAQEELVQAAKLAVLGQMSAGIAHETNQTLSAITYNAHNAKILLQRDRPEEAAGFIEKIGAIAERMGQTVNHLKIFARRPSKDIAPVALGECIQHALFLYRERLAKQNVEVRYDGLGEDILVQAEQVRLEQVIVNLVGNALDAMKDRQAGSLDISVTGQAPWVRLEITDNGCGIDPSDLDKVFDPFFTSKEVGEGLGLGLSISQKIIKDLNGRLTVRSVPGEGSTFSIFLKPAEA